MVALRLLGRTQPRPIVVSLVPRVNSVGEGTSLPNGLAPVPGARGVRQPVPWPWLPIDGAAHSGVGFHAGWHVRAARGARRTPMVYSWPGSRLPRTRQRKTFRTAARLLSQYSTLGELPFPLLRSEPLTMLEPVRPIAVCRRTEPATRPLAYVSNRVPQNSQVTTVRSRNSISARPAAARSSRVGASLSRVARAPPDVDWRRFRSRPRAEAPAVLMTLAYRPRHSRASVATSGALTAPPRERAHRRAARRWPRKRFCGSGHPAR